MSISNSDITNAVDIIAGDVANNNTVEPTGTLTLESGATGSGNLNNGGVINVGGTASATTQSSGTLNILSGGIASSTIVNGGSVDIEAGGRANTLTVNSGGTVTDSGIIRSVNVAYGGTVIVESGGVLSQSSTNSGLIEITSGGKLTNGMHLSGTIAKPAVIQIDAGADTGTATIFGFSTGQDGNRIDLLGFTPGAVVSSTTNGIVVISQGGQSISINDPNAFAGQGGFLVNDGHGGGYLEMVCFLAGTRLLGNGREIEVEALREGDLVATLVNGKTILKPVKWIGHKQVEVRQQAPDESYPVRICEHAFGEGKPRRDLLVTPEHCIFVDGNLIPARMLVNGASVVIDKSIPAYTYYHVELEEHAILLAEGLPAESYLDTGNRGNFANSPMSSLVPSWATDGAKTANDVKAAAPLATTRAQVEPVWQKLRDRAEILGFAPVDAMPALTDEPALHVLIGANRLVVPTSWHEGDYLFALPAGVENAWLLSRSARPSRVVGPFLDDRRQLGVAISEITLMQDGQSWVVDHFDAGLPGWHGVEETEDGRSRWTNGAAALALPRPPLNTEPVSNGTAFLRVRVTGTLAYPMIESQVVAA